MRVYLIIIESIKHTYKTEHKKMFPTPPTYLNNNFRFTIQETANLVNVRISFIYRQVMSHRSQHKTKQCTCHLNNISQGNNQNESKEDILPWNGHLLFNDRKPNKTWDLKPEFTYRTLQSYFEKQKCILNKMSPNSYNQLVSALNMLKLCGHTPTISVRTYNKQHFQCFMHLSQSQLNC